MALVYERVPPIYGLWLEAVISGPQLLVLEYEKVKKNMV